MTNMWVQLESSSHLENWVPVANVLTTNSTVPFVDYPPPDAIVRFYRVRSPGPGVSEMRWRWHSLRPGHYRYNFENFKPDQGGVIWAGTVTVSNGVVFVSQVTANGIPALEFDPNDFLTPDQVFDLLLSVELSGARLAHVCYDPLWGFPAAATLIASAASAPIQYKTSQFVEEEAGAANQALRQIQLRRISGPIVGAKASCAPH